jgi:hypothetical protein
VTEFREFADALHEHGFALTYAVRITECNHRNQFQVTTTVLALTGWDDEDAEEAVEDNAIVVDGVDLPTAEYAAAKLQEAGAAVEISSRELRLYAFDPADSRRGNQPIERIRVVDLGFAFEHGQLGKWTPNAVNPCKLDDLTDAIDERRRAWASAGKHEAASELSILERLSARDPILEDRLRTSDGEARRRDAAVYGDWLQAQGDPRGLIAAAALAVEEAEGVEPVRDERQRELDRLVTDHASHMFGPSHELMEAATRRWCGPVLDRLRLGPEVTRARLAELLAAPACACLRSLGLIGRRENDATLSTVLAAAPCAPGLRELYIGSSGLVNPTLRGDAFVRLERLTLRAWSTLGPARLPALRRLDVMLVPRRPIVAAFVELDTPALDEFCFSFRPNDHWRQTNLFELLSLPGFARLRNLKIRSGPLEIGFADLLARIPAIATLQCIDLRGVELSNDCRLELERNCAHLPGLQLRRLPRRPRRA